MWVWMSIGTLHECTGINLLLGECELSCRMTGWPGYKIWCKQKISRSCAYHNDACKIIYTHPVCSHNHPIHIHQLLHACIYICTYFRQACSLACWPQRDQLTCSMHSSPPPSSEFPCGTTQTVITAINHEWSGSSTHMMWTIYQYGIRLGTPLMTSKKKTLNWKQQNGQVCTTHHPLNWYNSLYSLSKWLRNQG